jgi:hypothetical protein
VNVASLIPINPVKLRKRVDYWSYQVDARQQVDGDKAQGSARDLPAKLLLRNARQSREYWYRASTLSDLQKLLWLGKIHNLSPSPNPQRPSRRMDDVVAQPIPVETPVTTTSLLFAIAFLLR